MDEERLVRVVMGKGRRDRNLPLTRAAAAARWIAVGKMSFDDRPRLTASLV